MRRSRLLGLLIFLAVVITALGTLAHFLKKEPEFYVREQKQSISAITDDTIVSSDVMTRLNGIMNDIRTPSADNPEWGASFSADELNAMFREKQSGNSPILDALLGDLPDPRVDIQGDRLLIAYRKGSESWSTIINLELRFWLVKDHVNLIALELVSFKAGDVPLPKYLVLNRIADQARKQNIDVNWYRDKEHPVALCQLYANQPQVGMQLTILKVEDRRISIGGRHVNVSDK